jgi:hypothetical protein
MSSTCLDPHTFLRLTIHTFSLSLCYFACLFISSYQVETISSTFFFKHELPFHNPSYIQRISLTIIILFYFFFPPLNKYNLLYRTRKDSALMLKQPYMVCLPYGGKVMSQLTWWALTLRWKQSLQLGPWSSKLRERYVWIVKTNTHWRHVFLKPIENYLCFNLYWDQFHRT